MFKLYQIYDEEITITVLSILENKRKNQFLKSTKIIENENINWDILNTSFNVNWFSIIFNPETLISIFKNLVLYYLTLKNYLVIKKN